jgi:hypothetical protein
MKTKEELKTLKDIEKLYDLGGEMISRDTDKVGLERIRTKGKENRKAFLNHLKQEAIKWIKYYQKLDKETEEARKWLRMWIVTFFNLTEEDLK